MRKKGLGYQDGPPEAFISPFEGWLDCWEVDAYFQTIRHSTEDEWHETRRKYGTSSEAVAIMNESGFKSPWDVAQFKLTGERGEIDNQDELDWNRHREDEIFHWWLKQEEVQDGFRTHDYDVQVPDSATQWSGYDLDPPALQIASTVDGFAIDWGGQLCVVEIKTASEYSRKWWDEGVPVYVYWQVVHQLVVTGLEKAYVVVSIGGRAPISYMIELDHGHADLLVSEWEMFFRDMKYDTVGTGWATDPAKLVPEAEEESDGDMNLEVLYAVYSETKEEKEAKDREYKEHRSELIRAMPTRIVHLSDVTLTVQIRANGAVYLYEKRKKT